MRLLIDVLICFGGIFLVFTSQALGKALVRQKDLNLFRLRPDSKEDRLRWQKSHALAARVVGFVIIVYGIYRSVKGT